MSLIHVFCEYIMNEDEIKKLLSLPDIATMRAMTKENNTACLRRSKATHFLENNVNIYYIRDFLGNESIQTTEIYLRTNQKIISKAIIPNSKKFIKDNIKEEQQQDNKCISDILNR